MEQMNDVYKQYTGVMIKRCDMYVVVSREDEGEKTITYVACPFPSCKLGFVDVLDRFLKKKGLEGVLSYEADDDLTILILDDTATNMRKIVDIVETCLMTTGSTHYRDITDDLKRQMRQFILATHQHWMTLEKYQLLNSIIDEQD